MFDILDHQGKAHLNYSVFYMPPVRISIVKKISDLKKKYWQGCGEEELCSLMLKL